MEIEKLKGLSAKDLEMMGVDSEDLLLKETEEAQEAEVDIDPMETEGQLRFRQLKEAAKVGYEYITDHARNLGLKIGEFPPEAIGWMPHGISGHGMHDSESNSISVKSRNLKVIIHEQLHFASSAKNRVNEVNFRGKRLRESGFHFQLEPNREGGEKRDIFRSLNEAVTEKLAGQIYRDRSDGFISDLQKDFPESIKIQIQRATEIRENRLKDLEENGLQDYNATQEYMMEEQSFEEFVEEKKRSIEASYARDLQEATGQDFISNPMESYKEEVRILEVILDRLAQNRSQEEGISFDQAISKEWDDLQKAYFDSDMSYLGRIEKVIGTGLLKLFTDIDRRRMNDGKETKEQFQGKVEALLKRIQEGVPQ